MIPLSGFSLSVTQCAHSHTHTHTHALVFPHRALVIVVTHNISLPEVINIKDKKYLRNWGVTKFKLIKY